MKPLTVGDLIADCITKYGYDGLYSEDGECACEVDDLAPCGWLNSNCKMGYRYWCSDADCEFTADAGRHWHMREQK